MPVSRFVSIAAPERQRLASPGWTLGFALLVAMVLYAVYPRESLERELARAATVDPVSMAYLNAWLRAKPDDYPLRLALAREQWRAGKLGGVESTLAPLLADRRVDNSTRLEAELLVLDVRQHQLWNLPKDDPGFEPAQLAYLTELRTVSAYPGWTEAQLRQYAATALALGDRVLTRDLLGRLLRLNPADLSRYEPLAQLDLGMGNYRAAAAVYFQALPHTAGLTQRRQYFLDGVKALTSGNLLNEAVASGLSYLGPLDEDDQTLSYLVNLALADHRLDVAAQLTSRLLHQHVGSGEGVG